MIVKLELTIDTGDGVYSYDPVIKLQQEIMASMQDKRIALINIVEVPPCE